MESRRKSSPSSSAVNRDGLIEFLGNSAWGREGEIQRGNLSPHFSRRVNRKLRYPYTPRKISERRLERSTFL